MPTSPLSLDDTSLVNLTQQPTESTRPLWEEIRHFKEHVFNPSLTELNKLLGQPTLSEWDKRRMANRFSRLINGLDQLLDSLKDYTLTRDVQEDLQLRLTYLREQLEQKQAQVFYQPDTNPQTLAANQQALLQDAQAKALYDKTLTTIQDFYHQHGYKFTCFISYAWPLAKEANLAQVQQFTQQDEAWVQPFLKQLRTDLRQAGIHALLDIVDNETGNNIYQFMARANSSDYVLLIGTESLLKKHQSGLTAVCNELIEIKRKRRADKAQGLPPRVLPLLLSGKVEHSFPPEYELYSTIREWQKKTYVTNIKELIRTFYGASQDNRDYKQLWQDFTHHYPHYLSTQDNAAYYIPPPEALPKRSFQHNLPARNPQFVGRDAALKQLESRLTQERMEVITQTVQGLGGVGKTQLALEYAHESLAQGKYHLIWWFDAKDLRGGYLSLADDLQVPSDLKPEERINAVKRKLADAGHWLLIFDDAQSYDSIQSYLPPMPGHVLITTRQTVDWRYPLTLEGFNPAEAKDLLTELLKDTRDTRLPEFETAARELAKLLGYLPLALMQAGAYIRNTGISVTAYIKLFTTQRQALWQKETPPRSAHEGEQQARDGSSIILRMG